MNENKLTTLFESVPLYKEEEFMFYEKNNETYSTISKDSIKNIYGYLGLVQGEKLITDCLACGGRFPFNVSIDFKSFSDSSISSIELGKYYDVKSNKERTYYYNFREPMYISNPLIFTETIKKVNFYIDYLFECTNNPDHIYRMILFACIDNEKIRIKKIGQFPENTILGIFKSKDFEKILKKSYDSFSDYHNAEIAHRYNLYSGAYAYLRRVFEKMINYYLEEKEKESGNKIGKHLKADEKIKAIKDCFEPSIQQYLYSLYSALSAGIHEMKEEECKEHYFDLKAIIDIQLQFEKSKSEVKNQIKESASTLNILERKYKKD